MNRRARRQLVGSCADSALARCGNTEIQDQNRKRRDASCRKPAQIRWDCTGCWWQSSRSIAWMWQLRWRWSPLPHTNANMLDSARWNGRWEHARDWSECLQMVSFRRHDCMADAVDATDHQHDIAPIADHFARSPVDSSSERWCSHGTHVNTRFPLQWHSNSRSNAHLSTGRKCRWDRRHLGAIGILFDWCDQLTRASLTFSLPEGAQNQEKCHYEPHAANCLENHSSNQRHFARREFQFETESDRHTTISSHRTAGQSQSSRRRDLLFLHSRFSFERN